MERRLFGWMRSSIVRFVIISFLVQISISATSLFFVAKASEANLAKYHREWVAEMRDDLVSSFQIGGEAALIATIQQRFRWEGNHLATILLANRDGKPVSGNLGAWPATLPQQGDWRTMTLSRRGAAGPQEVLLVSTLLPNGQRLLTGRVLEGGNDVVAIYEAALLSGLIVSFVAAMGSAILLGRILSKKLASVADTAGAVSASGLSARVVVDHSGDAFDRLGVSINAMLDRIDALVSELRLTTDGLAHDLKSPLTRLTAAIGSMRARADPARVEAEFDRIEQECDQLVRMLSTSLLISRTDGGMGRDQIERVDVRAMLHDIADLYEPLAEEAGMAIAVEVAAGLIYSINRELLQQAIGNIIENSVHYAIGATSLMLSARSVDHGLAIIVADNGSGIPADRRDEALRRFGRLDPARSAPGSGLGLSLVGAVARLHGGEVRLEDNEPGLRVVIRLMG